MDRQFNGYVSAVLLIAALASVPAINAADVVSNYDIGPRIGADVVVGFQLMAGGETIEDSNVITTESTMAMSIPRLTLSWGLGTRLFHFEPSVHIGRLASAELTGGKLLVPLQPSGVIGDYSSSAYGGGLDIRFKLTDTRIGFGLNFDLMQGSGTAKSWLDSAPDAKTELDAEFSILELGIVVDYNDPNFRPWVQAGIKFISNEFYNKPRDPALDFRVNSKDIYGFRAGLDIRHLLDSGFDLQIFFGYYGGLDFGIGTHYRFDLG